MSTYFNYNACACIYLCLFVTKIDNGQYLKNLYQKNSGDEMREVSLLKIISYQQLYYIFYKATAVE